MRIGDDQRIGLELGEFRLHAGKLLGRGLPGEFQIVHDHAPERRGRALGPDRIHRIGIGGHQRGAGGACRLGELLGAVGGMKPRVVAEAGALRQVRFEPLVGRIFDEVFDRKQRGVDLIAHLELIAAVDKDDGAVCEHDRGARRTGEGGQPGEPFV